MSLPNPKTFDHHAPDADQTAAIEALRAKCKEVYALIPTSSTVGREAAIAVTNLEQACMWGVKAIIFNVPDAVSAGATGNAQNLEQGSAQVKTAEEAAGKNS